MFTGIVEQVGTVDDIERVDDHVSLTVGAADWFLCDIKLGDSVSVNGACLTVVGLTERTASFDVIYETMRKTSLGHLAQGDPVNLERALPANGRYGGHIVQGHVDATGSIASIRQHDNSYSIYVDVPRDLMRYIVKKGSVCIDGISLTVVDAEDKTFSVSIIPHTWEVTNLSSKRAGDPVNIETDIIAKYVERMMAGSSYTASPMVLSTSRSSGGSSSFADHYGDAQYEMSQNTTVSLGEGKYMQENG